MVGHVLAGSPWPRWKMAEMQNEKQHHWLGGSRLNPGRRWRVAQTRVAVGEAERQPESLGF